MSFALNAAPVEGFSFNNQKTKTKSKEGLQTTYERIMNIEKKLNQKQVKSNEKAMSTVSVMDDADDEGLVNFNPHSNPELIQKGTRGNEADALKPVQHVLHKESESDKEGLLSQTNENGFESNPYMLLSKEESQYIKPMKQPIQKQPNSHEKRDKSIEEMERKLNYLIKLMEKKKEQNTQYITEEIVLYAFFGVFMIYVADSFTKVGKYVR